MRRIFLALIVSWCITSSYTSVCKTTKETTLKENGIPDTPCVFPFVYKKQNLNGCKRDTKGRYWCSTKTENGTNKHVKDNWGYCVPECDRSCNEDENCQLIPECPIVQEMFKTFKALGKKDKQKNGLKKKLKSLVCHSKPNKVCCPLSETLIIDRDPQISKTSYPSSCQNDPISSFAGNILPSSGSCGLSCNTDARVVNGKDAKLGEFPWAALLGYKAQKKIFDFEKNKNVVTTFMRYKCGGTLINTWYVLTAAHCHRDGSASKSVHQVVLGEWEVSETKLANKDPDCAAGGNQCMPKVQKILVEKVTIHSMYTKNKNGVFSDVALIRLKTEAVLNAAVQMACLPLDTLTMAEELNLADFGNGLDGYDATVIGWGHTSNLHNGDIKSHGVPNSILQKAKLPLWSTEECKNSWPDGFTVDHICAGAGVDGADSCRGDSGGGLFIKKNTTDLLEEQIYGYVQVGIVSYGASECGNGSPGVYTRVTEYIQWIRENIES